MTDEARCIEDRIFELLGEHKTPFEIVSVLGLDEYDGLRLVWKVIDERGTPGLNALRAAIEREKEAPRLVLRIGRWGLLQWDH